MDLTVSSRWRQIIPVLAGALFFAGCDVHTPESVIEGRVEDAETGDPIEGIYVELLRDCENPEFACTSVDDAITDNEGHFRVSDLYFAVITLDLFVNRPRVGRPDSLFRQEYDHATRSFRSSRTYRVRVELTRD
jgi:hypothetical protein